MINKVWAKDKYTTFCWDVSLFFMCVQAMGWCPWQRHVIATGGGWRDGELRIWDTQSASCVASYATNSQVDT